MTMHQFTPEEAARGAARTNEIVGRKRAEMRARSLAIHQVVDEVADLSPAALSAVMSLISKVEEGLDSIEVSESLDLQRVANTAEILHRIHRLASGQSTSNSAHATLTDEERRARMAQLRGEAPPPATDA